MPPKMPPIQATLAPEQIAVGYNPDAKLIVLQCNLPGGGQVHILMPAEAADPIADGMKQEASKARAGLVITRDMPQNGNGGTNAAS